MMKRLKLFLATAGYIAALAWGVSGCTLLEDEPPRQSITVTPPAVSLTQGVTKQLVVVGATPECLTGKSVSYHSDDPSIASVSAEGLIAAIAAGATTITVSAPGVTAVKVHVTVGSSLTGLSFEPAEVLLAAISGSAATQQLSVTTIPEGLTGVTLSYASANEAIATVSKTGLVTAVAAGSTTITVTGTAPGEDGTPIFVKVEVPVIVGSSLTGLSIKPTEVSLSTIPGGVATQQLSVTTIPEGLTGVTLSYASANEAIATVSKKIGRAHV
jgi:uncharacterized protein YjdB